MRAADTQRAERDLVLVGGGHTHVQVLRRWMMEPLPGVRLSVVVDLHEAVYSGMVPGVVAGDYRPDELVIDVLPLARRAGASCVHAAATRIDPVARTIELVGRAPLRYDVASLDVGSTVRGADLPGLREHSIPTRPIGRFVRAIEQAVERAIEGEPAAAEPLRVAVVGAGAAGVEIALCLEARLREAGRAASLTLITDAPDLLLGSAAMTARARAETQRRGIAVRGGRRVQRVDADGVELSPAESGGASGFLEADLVLWATGAAPHAWLRASPLPLSEAGFVRVDPTLQVEGYADLFAVGDCAVLASAPWVPRAGVYAVRQGPVLDHNLRARLREGRSYRSYRPQRDYLALLNLGGGRAIGGKWGLAFQGGWVWHLKDQIDRRFMRRFQVLDEHGSPSRHFPSAESMGAGGADAEDAAQDAMECGGCAAKLGPSPLQEALARLPPPIDDSSVRLGVAQADDAAAFETRKGDLLLASVDAFRAFADDPWLVGRIAATNAVSDVHAKGGSARHALAIVTVPDEGAARSAETLFQVLAGVRAALDPLGVSLVGGHSTLGSELFVGLSVTGELPGDAGWLPLDGLAVGDALILTKPLGTGVLMAADMRGLATGRWMADATAAMLRDNGAAAEIAVDLGAHACTDVSGFGLAGHLVEMLRASDLHAELSLEALPVLPGATELIAGGLRSSYHEQNTGFDSEIAEIGELVKIMSAARADPAAASALRALLHDPQTSGGLLIGIDRASSEGCLQRLRDAGYAGAAEIGGATAPTSGTPRISLIPGPLAAGAGTQPSR